MTRSVLDRDQFTPFGLWIRQYCRDSGDGLCVTNLDYVLEDFHQKKIMLLEEKQNAGKLGHGQKLSFQLLHRSLRNREWSPLYEYWGFYLLQFPPHCDMPGPGMTLNSKTITAEQLRDHCNFTTKFCDGYFNC